MGVISVQKIFGLCGLRGHKVEIRWDVTFVDGRTTECEDRAILKQNSQQTFPDLFVQLKQADSSQLICLIKAIYLFVKLKQRNISRFIFIPQEQEVKCICIHCQDFKLLSFKLVHNLHLPIRHPDL